MSKRPNITMGIVIQSFLDIHEGVMNNTPPKYSTDAKIPPIDFKIYDTNISNFLLSTGEAIPKELEQTLKEAKVSISHYAWNFCSTIWFEEGKFHNAIMQYRIYKETITGDSLEEVVKIANDKYGWD